MRVQIPEHELRNFKRTIGSEPYERDERDYKVALHFVIGSLLKPEAVGRSDFPVLLKGVLENVPDYESLGMDASRQQDATTRFERSGIPGPRGALTNLSGGRFGLAQFIWIPRAMEFGLGAELQSVFGLLTNPERALADRVDRFRSGLEDVQVLLRDRGGFLERWNVLPTSLSFVAALLGAYDPASYTFYAARPLKAAHEAFGVVWPTGSAGARYERICDFVNAVGEALRSSGVPVRDMIDSQSFIWLRARDRLEADTVEDRSARSITSAAVAVDDMEVDEAQAEPIPDTLESVQLEVSKRRNAIETRLRSVLRDGLRFAYGPRASERALSCLPEGRRTVLLQYSYGERWHFLYFGELTMIIEKEWPAFQNWFAEDKGKVLLWLDTINRLRVDAHAREVDQEELAFLRVCFRRLETALAVD
jgi:hypothetical protein